MGGQAEEEVDRCPLFAADVSGFGVNVSSFHPNVSPFRANVSSLRRMCPVGVDDAFGPAAPARRVHGAVFEVATQTGPQPAVGRRWPWRRATTRGARSVHSCWRRCVQFLPECVQFSGQCVQFSPHSAPDVFTLRGRCVRSGLTVRPRGRPQRGGSVAGFGVEIRRGSARRRFGIACVPVMAPL